MTDAEISRRLALAIGWEMQAVQHFNPPHDNRIVIRTGDNFRIFDYRDPAVIWPIAERFNAFPSFHFGNWLACIGIEFETEVAADTAAKAVAIAVIKAKEQK